MSESPHESLPDSGWSCCLADPVSRRAFVTALLGTIAAACAGPTEDAAARRRNDLLAQGADALAGGPTIDIHSHAGVRGTGPLPPVALREMRGARVETSFFNISGDGPVIHRLPNNGPIKNYRSPGAGELYAVAHRQCARVVDNASAAGVMLIREPADVEKARTARMTGALLAFEGGDPLEGLPERVREFHALGVRSIQLVHYRINELGDIQTEPRVYHRLTPAGEAVIAEMNRLGMIVDGAHAASETLLGILAASRAPIIVSHTGPAALRRNARHLTDDLITAVAKKDGVIGIWPLRVRGNDSLSQMLADIDHVRRIAGIDHVGIGTDMDGMSVYTVMPTYKEFAPLPAALLARGFSESDTRKVLGGNLMRVFEAATAARA